jgi:hypothetical protein
MNGKATAAPGREARESGLRLKGVPTSQKGQRHDRTRYPNKIEVNS